MIERSTGRHLAPPAPHRAWVPLRLGALVLALAAGSACATKQELATQLRVAMGQDQIPQVVACWETAFEAAGFTGQYEAVVDFTVTAGSGQVRDAVLHEIRNTATGEHAPPDGPGGDLGTCLVAALNASKLEAGGMSPRGDVHVVGFRIAFTGPASADRDTSSEPGPTLLLGPRADRCRGLYGHDPPLEAAALHQDLAVAQAEAAEAEGSGDRAAYARALQKTYDLCLELADRLDLDGAADDLSDEGRARIIEERARARRLAAEVGAKIGCTPPER